MAIPVAVPIVGAVALLGGGIALRLRSLAKAKSSITPIPVPPVIPKANTAPAAPPKVIQALPPVITNPDGTDHTVGTPFVFSTNDDAAQTVAEANRLGISVHELLLRKSGTLPPTLPGGPTVSGQLAIVTTNDPVPAGDLIIRSVPNGTQIGGAEKNGTVTILDSTSDPTFAKIRWNGGPRLPAATGFARKAFLKLL